jgi:hypothetical protein
MLYIVVKKVKIAPIREMFHHWIDVIKNTTPITCTSLTTRIAMGVGMLDEGEVTYLDVPRFIITKNTMLQGHTLKTNAAGDLLHSFSSCTNVIRLPNLDLCLYKCKELTFDLETTVEASRKSISGRVTRSRVRQESTSNSQQRPQAAPHPTATPPVHHQGWSPIRDMPGYVPRYYPGWEQPQQQAAGVAYPQPAVDAGYNPS